MSLSGKETRFTVASDQSPKNDAECGVHSAFTVLVQNHDYAAVSISDLLTICRAAPDYALRLIDGHRTILLQTSGDARVEIANLIREVEWELRGATAVIAANYMGSDDRTFIYDRLINHPDDFTKGDLHTLIQQNPMREHPIRIAAVERLGHFVSSLADKLAAEPPGMSEDIASLKRSITNYGFSNDLNEILQKIDDDLARKADAFDQAATMKHIRSFFEAVHKNVAQELQRRKPNVGNGTPLHQCGNTIDYLQRKQVITEKFQAFARCLYSILSDGDFGVHALKANRDYTRLCRNMVVEYAVTLFFELDRRLALPGDT